MGDNEYAFNQVGLKAGKQGLRDPNKKNTNRLEDLVRLRERQPK